MKAKWGRSYESAGMVSIDRRAYKRGHVSSPMMPRRDLRPRYRANHAIMRLLKFFQRHVLNLDVDVQVAVFHGESLCICRTVAGGGSEKKRSVAIGGRCGRRITVIVFSLK